MDAGCGVRVPRTQNGELQCAPIFQCQKLRAFVYVAPITPLGQSQVKLLLKLKLSTTEFGFFEAFLDKKLFCP